MIFRGMGTVGSRMLKFSFDKKQPQIAEKDTWDENAVYLAISFVYPLPLKHSGGNDSQIYSTC